MSEFRDTMTILRRTATFDWDQLGVGLTPSSLGDCLAWKPADMERAATQLEGAARRIAARYDATPGVDPGPVAYAPWVSAAAMGLAACPKVAERSGEQPGPLSDLCAQDPILRTIAHYGGRANDAAMDVRLCLSAFGWWLVRDVVTGLREQVAGMGHAEAERFLSPFAPMLVLLGQIMAERDANRGKTEAAVDKMNAQVQEAAEERDAAEADLVLRGEPKLPRETLLELARRGEEAPSPPRSGRRSRR